MDEPEDDMPISEKIVAFVLTLLAIPLLFVATCVPVGLLRVGLQTPPSVLFGIYGAAFVGFGVFKAVRTRNPGIRWGIVTALVVAAGFAAVIFLRS